MYMLVHHNTRFYTTYKRHLCQGSGVPLDRRMFHPLWSAWNPTPEFCLHMVLWSEQ